MSQDSAPREVPSVTALIVAAGMGLRAGGGVPKQYRMLAGEPVLSRTIRQFTSHPDVADVRVVISEEALELYETHVPLDNRPGHVFGGATREESVRNGLEALAMEDAPPDFVLIHDAARPFVDASLISACVDALRQSKAVVPALGVVDTLKRIDETGTVVATEDRRNLVRGQTPQGFHFNEILAAHRAKPEGAPEATDDAAIAETAGIPVSTIPGRVENIKLTTPEDFEESERRMVLLRETRTGQGYDVHRFCKGTEVHLCGVTIPHTHALQGHSDADVGLHALTDALLGALTAGDIGSHFPPSDPRWKGESSDVFLRHAFDLLRKQGGRITNLDVTLICEAPKIGPHRESMRARIAEILELETNRISVKATTTEKLGFTGREEGIAAQAVATITVPG